MAYGWRVMLRSAICRCFLRHWNSETNSTRVAVAPARGRAGLRPGSRLGDI